MKQMHNNVINAHNHQKKYYTKYSFIIILTTILLILIFISTGTGLITNSKQNYYAQLYTYQYMQNIIERIQSVKAYGSLEIKIPNDMLMITNHHKYNGTEDLTKQTFPLPRNTFMQIHDNYMKHVNQCRKWHIVPIELNNTGVIDNIYYKGRHWMVVKNIEQNLFGNKGDKLLLLIFPIAQMHEDISHEKFTNLYEACHAVNPPQYLSKDAQDEFNSLIKNIFFTPNTTIDFIWINNYLDQKVPYTHMHLCLTIK